MDLNKSRIYVSPNVSRSKACVLSSLSGIPLTNDISKYLGVPILLGLVLKAYFSYIIERLQKKLSGWKANILSIAGRRTLVQSFTSTTLAYSMRTMELPSSICENIDCLNRNFFGVSDSRKKIHLINWNRICMSKDQGG